MYHITNYWASLVAQTVKDLPAMQEIQVQSLGREDPLEKGMAMHSSILAWKIPWTEEPGGLHSTGLQREKCKSKLQWGITSNQSEWVSEWKSLSCVWLFVTPWVIQSMEFFTPVIGSLSLLQRIFPTQGSNPGLPHCRRILHQLSHKEARDMPNHPPYLKLQWIWENVFSYCTYFSVSSKDIKTSW